MQTHICKGVFTPGVWSGGRRPVDCPNSFFNMLYTILLKPADSVQRHLLHTQISFPK